MHIKHILFLYFFYQAFDTVGQFNLDKYATIEINNESASDSIKIHMEGYVPLSTEFYRLDSTLTDGSKLEIRLRWPAVAKIIIAINGEERMVHLIPDEGLQVIYRGPEQWTFPAYGQAYSDYSANLILGMNRISRAFLSRFDQTIPKTIVEHERNFLLYDSLENRLRQSPVDNRLEVRKAISTKYNLNDTSLVNCRAFIRLLGSYFFATYDLVMSDSIDGYKLMSYFGKQEARKEYYLQHFELQDDANLSIDEYLSARNAEYWTYPLREASVLPQSLFNALVYDSMLASIKANSDGSGYIYEFAMRNCTDEKLKRAIRNEYEKWQRPAEKVFKTFQKED